MLACCARSWGVGRYTAPTPTELVTVASYSALSSPRRAALAMIRKLREEALRDKKTKPLGRHEGAPRGSDTLATRSRGLAPFVLLSVATLDCSSRLGTQRLRLPSLGNPVGSPSSPM